MIPFSNEDLKKPIEKLIKTRIAPQLAGDGGAIEFLEVRKPKVYVQLQGACVGCPSSGNTLKYIVEKELKIAIHPELEVVNVPKDMEDKIGEL